MAKVFNRETKQYLESVNTPDYDRPTGKHWDNGNWIINPTFVPDCESKYIVVEGNDIREMVTEEKAIVDYVEPIPEPEPPTAEEVDKKRKFDIADEIALKHTPADEISYVRKLLTGESELTDADIMEWLADVANAKAKYPKVQL